MTLQRCSAMTLWLLLGACTANFRPDPNAPQREQIVQVALHQVGVPYRYAGTDPDSGFDCSGLVYYSYGQVGLKVPRSSGELMSSGRPVPYRDAQPGDLMFYDFEGKAPNKFHVVMLTAPGLGVHAPGTGRTVSTTRLDVPAWSSRYVGSVTLLRDSAPLTTPAAAPATIPPAAAPAPAPAAVITQIPDDPMAPPVYELATPEAPATAPLPPNEPITPPRAVEPLPPPQDGDNNWLPR